MNELIRKRRREDISSLVRKTLIRLLRGKDGKDYFGEYEIDRSLRCSGACAGHVRVAQSIFDYLLRCHIFDTR